jgi:protein TonB
MFEDSTFESTGRIRTRSRRWMLAALILNGSILLALILIPLINPEGLPRTSMLYLMQAPPPPEAPKPPTQQPQHPFRGASEMSGTRILAPPQIPINIARFTDAEGAPPASDLTGWDSGSGVPGGAGSIFRGHDEVPVVRPEPKGPVHISTTAMSAPLYRPAPIYPAIARAARVEGTVVLQAVISKGGTIENLHVTSGPAMLQQAAIDAVKQWRYRPYLLNGQPVEVETTINVVFTLGR